MSTDEQDMVYGAAMRRRKQARQEYECLRSKLGSVMRDYESIGQAFRLGNLGLVSGQPYDHRGNKGYAAPLGGADLVELLQRYTIAKAELAEAQNEFDRLDAC